MTTPISERDATSDGFCDHTDSRGTAPSADSAAKRPRVGAEEGPAPVATAAGGDSGDESSDFSEDEDAVTRRRSIPRGLQSVFSSSESSGSSEDEDEGAGAVPVPVPVPVGVFSAHTHTPIVLPAGVSTVPELMAGYRAKSEEWLGEAIHELLGGRAALVASSGAVLCETCGGFCEGSVRPADPSQADELMLFARRIECAQIVLQEKRRVRFYSENAEMRAVIERLKRRKAELERRCALIRTALLPPSPIPARPARVRLGGDDTRAATARVAVDMFKATLDAQHPAPKAGRELRHACAFCTMQLQAHEWVRTYRCGHTYHVSCAAAWKSYRNTCPACYEDGRM